MEACILLPPFLLTAIAKGLSTSSSPPLRRTMLFSAECVPPSKTVALLAPDKSPHHPLAPPLPFPQPPPLNFSLEYHNDKKVFDPSPAPAQSRRRSSVSKALGPSTDAINSARRRSLTGASKTRRSSRVAAGKPSANDLTESEHQVRGCKLIRWKEENTWQIELRRTAHLNFVFWFDFLETSDTATR